MGFNKLAHCIGDAPIVLRSLTNLAPLPVVVVASPALADIIRREHPFATLIMNAHPERGMTHSLRLAMPHIVPHAAVAVCLADVPLVTARDVITLEHARAAAAVDVAFPVRHGQPGHPVIFGIHARGFVASSPDGDTLRHLRDAVFLKRVRVKDEREEPYLDIDTPRDLERYAAHVN